MLPYHNPLNDNIYRCFCQLKELCVCRENVETNAYVIALVEVALIISTQLMQLLVRLLKHSLKEELFDNVGYVYETYT